MADDGVSRELVVAVLRQDESAARELVRTLYPLVAKLVRAHRPVRSAEEDVRRMEQRLAASRVNVEDFRRRNEIIDPAASAGRRQELDSKLQAEFIALRGAGLALLRAHRHRKLREIGAGTWHAVKPDLSYNRKHLNGLKRAAGV